MFQQNGLQLGKETSCFFDEPIIMINVAFKDLSKYANRLKNILQDFENPEKYFSITNNKITIEYGDELYYQLWITSIMEPLIADRLKYELPGFPTVITDLIGGYLTELMNPIRQRGIIDSKQLQEVINRELQTLISIPGIRNIINEYSGIPTLPTHRRFHEQFNIEDYYGEDEGDEGDYDEGDEDEII